MYESFDLSKNDLIDRGKHLIDKEAEKDEWNLREKVALACRILFSQGHDSGLSGQVTARTEPGIYLTQRLGLGFDEITHDNLITIDQDLNVIAGRGVPNPATRFHSWIYRNRPDVNCIIHTHPLYTSALSMLEKPLVISHMDACVLHDDIAFLFDWPGVPVGNEEGHIISTALGGKRALLLSHHGLVVVGQNVEEACVVAVQFERAAMLHMIASSVGNIQPIKPELGREAHDWVLHIQRSIITFSYYARQVLNSASSSRVVGDLLSPHKHA